MYDYKLYASSAFALARLFRLGDGYHHVKQFAEATDHTPRAPHFAELRFWELVTPATDNPDPKKKSSGYWAITDKGKQFVKGQITVPSRILVFNNKFRGFSAKSVDTNFRQAFGNEFNYEEVMAGL